jgi:hypothetical protein
MTNPEHLELLRQSVDGWNAWRGKKLSVTPDLSDANLSRANLSRADLSFADLSEATSAGRTSTGGCWLKLT